MQTIGLTIPPELYNSLSKLIDEKKIAITEISRYVSEIKKNYVENMLPVLADLLAFSYQEAEKALKR